jgi:hypothetical protein
MVKAFAYNKNRVPIAVQFFQFTIVDEVPVSTTVSGYLFIFNKPF